MTKNTATATPGLAIVSVLDFEDIDCSEVEGVVCTTYAEWARQQFGRGEVWGFFDEDNPGTDTGRHSGGHDFLLIDNRWVVDLWSKHVAWIAKRCVFDLQSEDDAGEISRLFGNQKLWSLVSRGA